MTTVYETWNHSTVTALKSDPTTCVGCAAAGVSSKWCATLRRGDACQKRIEARSRLLDVVVELIALAIMHHRETMIGPIVRALLDGHPLGILGDSTQ